jgi:hypothetical protein
MKLYKTFLHFLLTSASIGAFLMGWASLAHSLKPIQPVSDVATLEPLPPVGVTRNTNNSNSLIQFFSGGSSQASSSRFMTRGS